MEDNTQSTNNNIPPEWKNYFREKAVPRTNVPVQPKLNSMHNIPPEWRKLFANNMS